MTEDILLSLYGSLVQTLVRILVQHWPIVLFLVLLSALGRILRSPSVKGFLGERAVKRTVLKKLDPDRYHAFDDLYVPRPDGKGTTQIDHVIVSCFGIFVIETKNMAGWIFGDEQSRQWTQVIYRSKRRFQNPIHQNALHIRALSLALDLPKECFHNAIVFVGDAKLKTALPPFVMTRGLRKWILRHQSPLLTVEEVHRITERLSEISRTTDKRRVRKAHRVQLQRA